MKKILTILCLGIVLISLASVSAVTNEYAPVKQSDCVTLKQTCGSCSYSNISVSFPNSTLQTINEVMIDNGGGIFTYQFCNTTNLGRYDVMTCGDINGVHTCTDEGTLWFHVTPSGEYGNSKTIAYIFIALILYAIGFIGFFGKSEWISALGGMAMMAFGVYTINNGLIIFRDWITNYFSYVTIGVGAIFALVSIIETIQENL